MTREQFELFMNINIKRLENKIYFYRSNDELIKFIMLKRSYRKVNAETRAMTGIPNPWKHNNRYMDRYRLQIALDFMERVEKYRNEYETNYNGNDKPLFKYISEKKLDDMYVTINKNGEQILVY